MQRLLLILLGSLMLLTLSSCAMITLHPVDDQDIKVGGWCQQGWVCMSQDYVKTVMKVRLEHK
jgi:hypothetical protein